VAELRAGRLHALETELAATVLERVEPP
jgi:hypothetical protein